MSSETFSAEDDRSVEGASTTPALDVRPPAVRWRRGLLITTVIVVALVLAVRLIPGNRSTPTAGPMRTHEITRGDLLVTVTEQGTLESSNNREIKCKVRGANTIIWVIENGTEVQAGDELVRLETLLIEEEISERTKYAHLSRSAAERSKADMVRAKLAISEYLEGRFVSTLAARQKEVAVAESRQRTAKNMLDHAELMSASGYVSELEVEEKRFAVNQADLDVKLKKLQIEVLNKFTREEQLAILTGNWNATKAQYEANKETTSADEERLRRAKDELQQCVIKAESPGMVIYPTAEEWKQAPEIEEGATVHKDQVLLLMPDMSRMQVKVGIHESIIDRVTEGLDARVTLLDRTREAKVSSVASVTNPAGWWTGNVVKYDTIIELPATSGLKPGMSAEVEVIIARHTDVLTVPSAAIVETNGGYACWVKTAAGVKRRPLELGDSSEMSIVVESGLKAGERVVLDPLAFVPAAQTEAARVHDTTRRRNTGKNEL